MSFSHAKRLGQTFNGKPAKKKIDLNKPVASMTPAEEEFADSVIREHFAEDRTEIIQQAHSTKRRLF
jgi:hypothetical protein